MQQDELYYNSPTMVNIMDRISGLNLNFYKATAILGKFR